MPPLATQLIGAGPSGIAAAKNCLVAGLDVVVFEKNDRVGGLLRYGIPDFKLEKWTIDRRLEQLQAEGVAPWPLWWMLLWSGTLGSNLTVAGAPALYAALNIQTRVKLVEPKAIPRSEGKAKRVVDQRRI